MGRGLPGNVPGNEYGCCNDEELHQVLFNPVRELGRLFVYRRLGYSVISFEADKVGSGIHQIDVAKDDLVRYAQLANASQIMYGPLIFITKLSILLLYLRVFAPNRKSWLYMFIQLLLWFNAAFYLADTLIEIFECVPRERIWNPDSPGKCVNIQTMILATAVINTVSDISLLILPIFCVWRLHMRTAQKFGISAVFAAGLFGCFASIMRLVISIQNGNTQDKTHDWFPEFLWTSAEICAGIIASCLPAIPSFFRHVGRKAATVISSGNHRSKSNNGYGSSSKSQRWSSRKRLGWNSHGENNSQSDYRELDEIQGWQGGHSDRGTESHIRAGDIASDEVSNAESGISRMGILKTVDVEVEEASIR
ncbi:uncharacterized protein N7498_000209 [Penicillium cinerascens]|uniref:Integral membrane protein n=1 Tax=Penicillium cinerascens TaxID=70096 RepID=A0A9W9NDZ1_9EURO|nr:uncharacterized protein N7498_000209 [Penicillium cinerascens]KAJ5218110.1 integral membrane protein [Penicillium cinerascens]